MIREVIHQILNCMGTTKVAAKYDHEVTSRLVLCQPNEERARRERRWLTFRDTLLEDKGKNTAKDHHCRTCWMEETCGCFEVSQ